MTLARVRPAVIKEIRALFPAWMASLCAIGAAALIGPRNRALGLVAYSVGSVTLGALSIGHEYTNRTLAQLLSLPSSRRRLLLIKLGVLTAMLLTLAAVAWPTVLRPGERQLVVATILCSLSLAPLLTMTSRNPLMGPVFVGAMPMWISVLSRLWGFGIVWGVTLAVCVPAAVASWRLFMRLEAIEGRDPDLHLPRWLRRAAPPNEASVAPAYTRHPVWLLVKKELHLQQMTFAVAGVWVLIWIAISASTRIIPGFAGFPLPVVGILYGGLLALLIGSIASGEERQMGTLEWQQLLPMAAWKQWAVKVVTILGVAGLLSFALPVMLAAGLVSINAWHAGAIAVVTIGSLYVSSLSRSGLRALMVAAPVLLILGVLSQFFYTVYGRPRPPLAVLLTVVVALLLWFGFENHRSAGHDAGRVSMQVLSIAGCLGLFYLVS